MLHQNKFFYLEVEFGIIHDQFGEHGHINTSVTLTSHIEIVGSKLWESSKEIFQGHVVVIRCLKFTIISRFFTQHVVENQSALAQDKWNSEKMKKLNGGFYMKVTKDKISYRFIVGGVVVILVV